MEKLRQLIAFTVGVESFAVPIELVREIVRVPAITPVPDVPAAVEGVMNLRGRIVPVLNLRACLAVMSGDSAGARPGRVVVIEIAERRVGLRVDAVSEVVKLAPEQIQRAHGLLLSSHGGCAYGIAQVADRLIVVLDLELLLQHAMRARNHAERHVARAEPESGQATGA